MAHGIVDDADVELTLIAAAEMVFFFARRYVRLYQRSCHCSPLFYRHLFLQMSFGLSCWWLLLWLPGQRLHANAYQPWGLHSSGCVAAWRFRLPVSASADWLRASMSYTDRALI